MKQFLLTLSFFSISIGFANAQYRSKGVVDAFAARTGAIAAFDNATNSVSSLRFPVGRAFEADGNDIRQKSASFLIENGNLFGLREQQDTYRFKEEATDLYGLGHVTMEQTFNGVPVFDGVMKFHYNRKLQITSVNGNYISDIKINTTPKLSSEEAATIARRYFQKQKNVAGTVVSAALYVFQKGLAQGYNGAKLLVYEVEISEGNLREFYYIDAHNSQLVEQFSGSHGIQRELYEGAAAAVNLIWQEANPLPETLDKWQQSQVATAGHVYNFFLNAFGHTSYDGADAKMSTVNNSLALPCPNASWDGKHVNFCEGVASDDIVAHEWAHAYTEHTSKLLYSWQAGAINEAYSDIWGETVDLLNGYMDENENHSEVNGCGTSARWIIGEKAEAQGLGRRNMWEPTCYGQPGKMSDPQYHCAASDFGGVHINSGILNHAFALLVDGGTYNRQTVTGIGLVKAAHIFWRAQKVYMTRTTDFAALATHLEMALSDLTGLPLQRLSTAEPAGIYDQVIDSNDAQQLLKVLAAVEMRNEPGCGFEAILKDAPALCEGASPANAIFFEDFENGFGGFTVSEETFSQSREESKWKLVPATHGKNGNVVFGPTANKGNCRDTDQSGVVRLESPEISIPAETPGDLFLAFDHRLAIEHNFDGGNIRYSFNGSEWYLVPAEAFVTNPYNGICYNGGGNPLSGQPVFTGMNQSANRPEWGQSQINLSKLGLAAGGKIRLRWELGTDCMSGLEGWFLDDIRVFACAVLPEVHFVTGGMTVNEQEADTPAGCLPYLEKTLEFRIDKAPSHPVTVTLATDPASTANLGANADFTISPATFTLSAEQLSQQIVVRVFDDAYVEGEELAILHYTMDNGGGDAFAGSENQTFTLRIADNDITPEIGRRIPVYSANFDFGLDQWKITNGGNSLDTWHYRGLYRGQSINGTSFLMVDSDDTGQFTFMDETVESPEINTAGMKGLHLRFREVFETYYGAYPEQGYVDIWDGSNWQTIFQHTEDSGTSGSFESPARREIAIPDAYCNPAMKVRFRYVANWDYRWAIDAVEIFHTPLNEVRTIAGNSNPAYLGPKGTAYFYGPSGDLIAKIFNKTDHDYGCTTVSIDRTGNNETRWVGGYNITNKTFRVTPAVNHPAGNYAITLYFKNSELSSFRNRIHSMGKSSGAIGTDNIASASFAETQSSAAYSSDFAYTATFTSGFSGFGLSDAPPVGALPVSLTAFNGKTTSEGNVLSWETASEVDNDHFIIERSEGSKFVEVGRIAGQGTSAIGHSYNFTDRHFKSGQTYYRLKQVDTDGSFAHSRIVVLKNENARQATIYPNPVSSKLHIQLPGKQTQRVQLKILSPTGQTVLFRERAKVENGVIVEDISRLAAGIYQVIVLEEGQENQVFSVIKL